jgi:hypothetical protein
MSLQVQDIVNAVSVDVRQVIGATGTDASIMIGWVDRVHKDALHSSLYSFLNQASTTVASVAGTYSYTLTPVDIRRVLAVFDRTFSRALLPLESESAPVPLATHVSPPGGMPPDGPLGSKLSLSSKTIGPWPEYYRFFGTQTLSIFPAPTTATWAGTLEVQYEKQVASLANLTDVLVVPEDGKDLLVAGVNSLAFTYLKQIEDATIWGQQYERMKKGEVIL